MAFRAMLVALVALALGGAPAHAVTPRSFLGVIADGPALKADGGLGDEAAAVARSGTRTIRVAA